MFIELSLEPDAKAVQEDLQPEPDEIIEAEEKISAAKSDLKGNPSTSQTEKAPI